MSFKDQDDILRPKTKWLILQTTTLCQTSSGWTASRCWGRTNSSQGETSLGLSGNWSTLLTRVSQNWGDAFKDSLQLTSPEITWINHQKFALRFTHGITTWPCLNELGPESCSSTMCGACEKGKATTQLQMFGQPYNNNTLATLPPKPEAMLNRVSCFLGTNCTKTEIFWLALSKTVGINSNAVALIHY